MAFQVEDGTGLEDSNSYSSVENADTYFSDRGNADWAAAEEEAKQQALIKATDYIDGKYGRRWIGERGSSEQALEWPRIGALDAVGEEIEGIPVKLERAVSEAALLILNGTDLFESLDRGGKVKRETVGPITTEYADSAPASAVYPSILRNIAALIRNRTEIRITR